MLIIQSPFSAHASFTVHKTSPRPACAGHSVNALQGRWQKNKDVYWYTRDTGNRDAAEAAELLAVKQREEDLMAEVL